MKRQADTRMMLHVKDAVADVIIAISCFKNIEQIKEMWIAFRVRKMFRYLSVHNIANALGPQKSRGLLFLHAFRYHHLQTSVRKDHGIQEQA